MKLEKRKWTKIENRGFSLVELLVVIVLMTVLVAITVSQIVNYAERTKVTADRQLAESVRTAIRVAMMDPEVLNDADSEEEIAGIARINNTYGRALALSSLSDSPTAFAKAVAEALDITVAELADVDDWLRSGKKEAGRMEIRFWIMNGTDAGVVIVNSDDGFGKAIVVE